MTMAVCETGSAPSVNAATRQQLIRSLQNPCRHRGENHESVYSSVTDPAVCQAHQQRTTMRCCKRSRYIIAVRSTIVAPYLTNGACELSCTLQGDQLVPAVLIILPLQVACRRSKMLPALCLCSTHQTSINWHHLLDLALPVHAFKL